MVKGRENKTLLEVKKSVSHAYLKINLGLFLFQKVNYSDSL